MHSQKFLREVILVAFTNYLLTTIFPLLFFSIMAAQLSATDASAKQIYEVIDSKPKITEKPKAIKYIEYAENIGLGSKNHTSTEI